MSKTRDPLRKEFLEIYRRLRKHFGFLDWWPADSPFEVMVGAILTQNTAWSNVERAIFALEAENLLSPEAILKADLRKLKRLIRPSGYFNQKALRLKIFAKFFISEYNGSIARMKAENTDILRDKLLAVKGIGPETADSMLLYALDKPVFVVDAYTRRIFSRLGFLPPEADYYAVQKLFTAHLPPDLALYNDFHAQIVYLGKDYCGKKPGCATCPLTPLGRCREKLRA